MARGFSVVAKTDGATVNSAAQVVEGERVAIHFFKGNALADIVTRQFTSKNL
jgi:exonuclease VII large subunit